MTAAGSDENVIDSLLPVSGVGASVLLIYLLRVWVIERRTWQREREQMIVDHRAEIAVKQERRLRERAQLIEEHHAATKAAVADLEAHVVWLRNRVAECEAEVVELRRRDDRRTP